MKKRVALVTAVLVGASLVFSGIAVAETPIPASDKVKRESAVAGSSLMVEKQNGDLALRPPGLEKLVFIHYKKGFGKASAAAKGRYTPQYYRLLGVKWKRLPVNYVVDPDNSYGLSEASVTRAVYLAAKEWDDHTSAPLFGTYTIDRNATWDDKVPDGKNEIVFGNYPQAGVIGVTVIWGYFSGPASSRMITEFDVLLDTDYTWGDATVNSAVMDVQNIATHELGHGVGLADVYDSVCSEQTMYGYSSYGETKKRDLNSGDVTGIQVLYGR